MKLTTIDMGIAERLTLGQICPATDGIDRLILRKEILEKTAISGSEAELIGLKSEMKEKGGSTLQWNLEKAVDKPIQFSDGEMTYIKSVFQKLNEKKELHASQVDLYQKFCK